MIEVPSRGIMDVFMQLTMGCFGEWGEVMLCMLVDAR